MDVLARSFRVSSGNVRNIVFEAAYLADDDDRPVGMANLVRATEREYQNSATSASKPEFGPYDKLVSIFVRLRFALRAAWRLAPSFRASHAR